MTNEQTDRMKILGMTTDIISAHAANNAIPTGDLPQLIRTIFEKLSELTAPTDEVAEELQPAVPIKKSVTDEYIICLEDGRKLKMLKRHLETAFGMTPEEYRAKWGLPQSYPMVAASYSRKRQELAKQIGLGRGKVAKPKRKKRAA